MVKKRRVKEKGALRYVAVLATIFFV